MIFMFPYWPDPRLMRIKQPEPPTTLCPVLQAKQHRRQIDRGADIAQGGWRSRGNQGEGVYLTWQTPHSWFTLLDSEEQYGFGPGTKQLIRSMFQEHGKHRTAVRALRGMRLPPKVIALIVDGHAGLALPRRKRNVFAQAEGEGW